VLEAIDGGAARVRMGGGLTYEVLLPSYAAARLGGKIDQPVTLHTLHYIESQNQGATMTPRLAGFLTERDRRFFELFTTVKGIGVRKALRCMTLDTAMLAAAIADRDTAMLQSLPEIGKRSAETIIVTLKDKVDAFLDGAPAVRAAHKSGVVVNMEPVEAGASASPQGRLAREAIEVLVKLGENRVQAAMWIDRVLQQAQGAERPGDVSALIARVYEVRGGV